LLAALAPVYPALAPFRWPRAPHYFGKMLRRLDREWLDCIVFKTHCLQLSKPRCRGRDRQVTFGDHYKATTARARARVAMAPQRPQIEILG
jgi:hypothetical protein